MVWCTHCAVKVFHCESNLQELDKTISESTPAKFSNAAWYGMQNTGRHTDFLAISTIELCCYVRLQNIKFIGQVKQLEARQIVMAKMLTQLRKFDELL